MAGTVTSSNLIGFNTSPSVDTQTAPYDSAASVLLTGTALANAGIQNIEIYDNGRDIGAAIIDPNKPSKWSLDVDLTSGTHQFTATAFGINGPLASATSPFTLVTGLTDPSYTTAEYDTDGNGNPTGEQYFDASGTLRRQKIMNGAGTLISDTSYDKTGVVTSDTEYSNNGTLLSQTTYDKGVITHQTEYNANGTLASDTSYDKTGSTITSQALYDSNGQPTYKTTSDTLGNIISKTWYDSVGNISEQKTYDATGVQTIETIENGQNSHIITGKAARVVLDSVFNDIITGGGAQTTYRFSTSFGHDEITNFVVAGTAAAAGAAGAAATPHDLIDLPSAKLKSVAAVLQHTTMSADGSAVIHLDHNNSIKLDGVTKAELMSNPSDFHFHT